MPHLVGLLQAEDPGGHGVHQHGAHERDDADDPQGGVGHPAALQPPDPAPQTPPGKQAPVQVPLQGPVGHTGGGAALQHRVSGGQMHISQHKKIPSRLNPVPKEQCSFGTKSHSLRTARPNGLLSPFGHTLSAQSIFRDVHAAAKNGFDLIRDLRAANSARLFLHKNPLPPYCMRREGKSCAFFTSRNGCSQGGRAGG